jgi:hypothetical protein
MSPFFSIFLILPATPGSGVYSASKINVHQKEEKTFLKNRVRPARKADNLTAFCGTTV